MSSHLSTLPIVPPIDSHPIPLGSLAPFFEERFGRLSADRLTAEECRAWRLNRRPGSRHVTAYRLVLIDHDTGQRSIVELIEKKDTKHATGKAAKEFETIQRLWQLGFNKHHQFKIPEAIYLSPDKTSIFQDKAHGQTLTNFVGQNNQASVEYSRMAGLWLARLHNLKAAPARNCSYDEDLSALRRFVSELSALHPALSSRLVALETAIRAKLLSFCAVPLALVHGDYHPEHIFVEDGKITVIDFERSRLSDPAKDLGSFIAHMRIRTCLSGKPLWATDSELQSFLEAYFFAIALAPKLAVVGRIAPFVVHSCMEALYYVASVLKVDDPDQIAIYLKCMENSGQL